MGLDAPGPQPTRRPEAVSTGRDVTAMRLTVRPARAASSRQRRSSPRSAASSGAIFLQGVAIEAGDDRRDEPTPLAHFHNGNDRGILLEGRRDLFRPVGCGSGTLRRLALAAMVLRPCRAP